VHTQWWDEKLKIVTDANPLPPRAEVRVRSQFHLERPAGYTVFEVVPKFMRPRKFKEVEQATYLNTEPDGKDAPDGTQWSERWSLPEPLGDQTRVRSFIAKLDGGYFPGTEFDPYRIHCGALTIEQLDKRRSMSALLDPKIEGHSLQLGKFGGDRGSTLTYKARAALDPPVSVSVVSGYALARHLAHHYDDDESNEGRLGLGANSSDFERYVDPTGSWSRGSELPQYEEVDFVLEPGRSRLIDFQFPDKYVSSATAIALMVTRRDTRETYFSEPAFLTLCKDGVVASDIPAFLLSLSSWNLLKEFSDLDQDIEVFADGLKSTVQDTWDRLSSIATELGVTSISDAVQLQQAEGRAPTHGWQGELSDEPRKRTIARAPAWRGFSMSKGLGGVDRARLARALQAAWRRSSSRR